MNDALAIVWKESREVLGQRGLRGKSGILLNIAVFGVILPIEFGASWVTSPVSALAWSWVPMYFVMMVIADAVAGERERHTLETLLATRLSDSAILFGKMGAAIAYAAAITAVSLVLGLVTVNIAYGHGDLLLYRWSSVVAMVTFGFLGAILVASGGVLISLRAPTVRDAQQTLGGAIIVALLIPLIGVRLAPPAWKAQMVERSALVGVSIVLLLAAIDAGLVAVALARFTRPRLTAAAGAD